MTEYICETIRDALSNVSKLGQWCKITHVFKYPQYGGVTMIYSKILVAYDSSIESEEAIKHAIMLCEYFPGTTLLVIHILTLPNFIVGEAMINASADVYTEAFDHAQAIVDNAKSLIASIPNASVELIQGNAGETIVALSQERFFDLIVIGSRGLGAIRELMLGSVSHYVVQHALIPVLVVK
jgi:nucleotide-binding universal stress UspA family protein